MNDETIERQRPHSSSFDGGLINYLGTSFFFVPPYGIQNDFTNSRVDNALTAFCALVDKVQLTYRKPFPYN